MNKNKICIVSLIYLEPYWEETKKNIIESGYPVIYVDREGIGSMTKAFNSSITKIKERFKNDLPEYLFFVTNINFDKKLIDRLISSMDSTGFGAIHPTHQSHHKSHNYADHNEVVETKFIEWTSPIVKTDLFLKLNLNENHRYWYFDLIWSYEAKKMGYKLGVDHGAKVGHTYLFDNKSHIISKIRDDLRWYHNPEELKTLIKNYGLNWKQTLMKDVLSAKVFNIKQIREELSFWKTFVKTDRFLKDWIADRKTSELDEYVSEFIKNVKHDKILDVGSGPVSILHGLLKNSDITAVDALADYYQQIFNFKKYKINPPIFNRAETLNYESVFDIVHISNALDHCQDLNLAVNNLYKAVKQNGYLIIQTFEKEGTEQKWAGFHKWDISYSAKGIYAFSENGEKNLIIENSKIYKIKRQRKLYNRIWTILIIKKI
jgi:SAM-dependent methyltransferase